MFVIVQSTYFSHLCGLVLPPAHVVRREGNVFTGISMSVHTGEGTPVPDSFSGFWSQILSRRYPSPRFFPRSLVPGHFQGVYQSWPGEYPSPSWGGGTPVPGRGYRSGVPPAGLKVSYFFLLFPTFWSLSYFFLL